MDDMPGSSTNNQTSYSSSPDTISQADMPGSSSCAVHPVLQLIQSDDPDLKLQAAKEIQRLTKTSQSCRRQLSGSIQPLISMLRVNSPESHQKSALLALLNLAIEDQKNKINIVEAGALEPIISFLQSQSSKLQEYATASLFTLSASAINKSIVGASGVIPLLVKILRQGRSPANIDAVMALFNLSTDPNNLKIILGTNPIPSIVSFLETCDKSSKTAEKCCALIESLVGFDEGSTALTYEVSGLLAVVEVLENGSLQSREHTVGALLTMCQSGRCKYRDPILIERIIPGLLKLIVNGTPKSKSKAQALFRLLMESPHPSPKLKLDTQDLQLAQVSMEQSLSHLQERAPRAKFYCLNDNDKWDDQGAGYVTIGYLERSNEKNLFVIGEEDIEPLILHRICRDDIYKHEDKSIQWRDPEYFTGLALSFEETTDCSYIWDHICSVQRNLNFNTLNTSLRQHGGSTRESNDTNTNVGFIDQEAHYCRDSSYQKVTLKWIFVIANFILELPLAVIDQLSSVQKPKYALITMLMSFVAMLVCVLELIYKGKKERVMWRWSGRIPWFYYPSPSDMRFGTFADIVGLGCAIPQFIVTTVNYSFSHRHADNPIKISVWPIIFAFGLLCSRFLENPNRTPSSRVSP